MLQCVVVCCSVLQCVAVCCSLLAFAYDLALSDKVGMTRFDMLVGTCRRAFFSRMRHTRFSTHTMKYDPHHTLVFDRVWMWSDLKSKKRNLFIISALDYHESCRAYKWVVSCA